MGRNGADSGKCGRAHEDNISAKNGRCGKVAASVIYLAFGMGGRAHLARQCAARWKEQLGGRSCGSAKLLAGTLRCLRLVDFSLGVD